MKVESEEKQEEFVCCVNLILVYYDVGLVFMGLDLNLFGFCFVIGIYGLHMCFLVEYDDLWGTLFFFINFIFFLIMYLLFYFKIKN